MYSYLPPKSNCFGHSLGKMGAPHAHELLDKFFATSVAEHKEPPDKYCKFYVISKWRIGNEEIPTTSYVWLFYTQPLRLATQLSFESIEQFYHIKRVLEDLGLCKLNEKHLRFNGRKIKPNA